MKKRTCPECEKNWFSSNEQAEYWRCGKCGTKIPREMQKEATILEEEVEGKIMRILVVGVEKDNIGDAVVRKLKSEGHEVIVAGAHLDLDAANEVDVRLFFDWLEDKGDLDAIVNCAGVNILGGLPDYSLEDFQETVDSNLTTNFLLLREYTKRYDGNGKRKVFVAVTSDTAEIAKSHSFAYGASKAGANHFIRCAAREMNQCSFDKSKWVITAIAPGRVNTPMDKRTINDIMENRDISYGQANEMLNDNIPIKRSMNPGELAEWINFIIEKGDYATGCVFRLDAGQQQG